MIISHGCYDEILELKNFMSDEQCDYIVENIKNIPKKDKFHNYSSGYKREGITYRIRPDSSDIDRFIFENLISKLCPILFDYPFYADHLSDLKNIQDSGYDFHRYSDGEGCKKHYDGIILNNTIAFAAISLGLNTPTDGGEILFDDQNIKIKTEKGKGVVWPTHPFYKHEITPPSGCHRDVIITWLCYGDYYAIRK